MLNVEEQTPCHQGMIEVIVQDGDYFLTAGADGYVKWWKVAEIDQAEAEEGTDVALKPLREVLIAENDRGDNPAHIMNMILADDQWYIQDFKGKIWVMDHNSDNYKLLYIF